MGPAQFIAALGKRKPVAAYFLRGPDRFLHEECRRAILAALPPEAREWCLAEIEFEAKRLRRELEDAYQMPMLGGHSFLIFCDPEDFKHAADEDFEALQGYLERPSPFATVVFVAVEPDRRRRFIQLLEKKAELVEMQPLDRRDAARWLKAHLAQAGVEIEPALADEVAAKFESAGEAGPSRQAGVNLLWMRTEIEKVLTAKPGVKRLKSEDLELMVAFREEHEIGKLLRAVAERQLGPALENLRALLASKQSEMLILWCVGDLFRQALKARASAASGRRPAPYYAGRGGSGRQPFSTQEIALIAVRKYSHQELLQALRNAHQADLRIKSSWKDSRILLEFLIWQVVVGKASGTSLPVSELAPVSSAEA
jgi:DNA polymerase-3 subunit delta